MSKSKKMIELIHIHYNSPLYLYADAKQFPTHDPDVPVDVTVVSVCGSNVSQQRLVSFDLSVSYLGSTGSDPDTVLIKCDSHE